MGTALPGFCVGGPHVVPLPRAAPAAGALLEALGAHEGRRLHVARALARSRGQRLWQNGVGTGSTQRFGGKVVDPRRLQALARVGGVNHCVRAGRVARLWRGGE